MLSDVRINSMRKVKVVFKETGCQAVTSIKGG